MLAAHWGLAGFSVSGTMHAYPADHEVLNLVRQCLTATFSTGDIRCGLTLINDMLVGRVLADHTEQARAWLSNVWKAARPLLQGREARPPAIWNT